MPARPEYAIDKEPCVPVRFLDGHQESLGLRDVLLRAHEIEDLALPLPPAASALLRVLIATTARVTGLDDPEMSAGEWTARRRLLLQEPGGFDSVRVHDYFDAFIWDLFHRKRPYLQDPRLAAQWERRAGVNTLVFGRPAGNNLAWLSAHSDMNPVPVPCPQALWHLLAQHYYGAAGTCSKRTLNGRSSIIGKAGPLRSTVSFHSLGRTLYETLLAGMPKFTGDWNDADDLCPWEEPELPDPLGPLPPVTWPGRLLTGRSRHAILFVPTPDGKAVADAYLTWASQEPKLPAFDPYLIHDVDPKKPVPRRITARPANADRAVWRDLDALLLAGDETSTTMRPVAFHTLNDLPRDLRATLRVRVHGFDQDRETNNRTWYTALTPPIWPWTQEHDPAKAQRIAECRTAAEDIGTLLAAKAAEAWRETITPSTARSTRPPRKAPKRLCSWTIQAGAAYWPRAETTFWRLIEEPETPARRAFATDAAAALREVTRPAIVQYRRAAPAVARAAAALFHEPGRRRPRAA
ncbi:type I-E CRISPR-associated protein Cse1/CasA [Streptomyces himalayensis]|uniref:type I-E CRISPR-associated protein Cse1/CasA n=1 Tax=Streptomyces himalayensis TaxID=2820085 RepID=UPI0028A5826C|nr:type I-E CRISPR-associated protein Cse1/CasA [Streptomyces himalayensis]